MSRGRRRYFDTETDILQITFSNEEGGGKSLAWWIMKIGALSCIVLCLCEQSFTQIWRGGTSRKDLRMGGSLRATHMCKIHSFFLSPLSLIMSQGNRYKFSNHFLFSTKTHHTLFSCNLHHFAAFDNWIVLFIAFVERWQCLIKVSFFSL